MWTKKIKQINISFSIVFYCIAFSFSQQNIAQTTSKLIDSVSVNTAESFAIYFPKKHLSTENNSIVFIFDPSGNGKGGIAPFIKTAETYNHILVCSNNSKNGILKTNLDIANRLFDYVLNNYKIDQNKMYLAGFSGGSRLASTIALQTNAFYGVIACGAGINAVDKYILPSNKFRYAGFVGKKDMNYSEMLENKIWLDNNDFPNELYISDNRHIWPSEEEILTAFDWFEIEKLHADKEKNKTLIQEYKTKYVNLANKLIAEDKLEFGVLELERIRKYFDKDEIVSERLDSLKKTKEYKSQISNENKLLLLEEKLTKQFELLFNEALTSLKVEDLKWSKLYKNIEDLEKNKNSSDIVFRIKYRNSARVYESGYEFKLLKQENKYKVCQQLLEKIKELNKKSD
jgi:hypothetical protein